MAQKHSDYEDAMSMQNSKQSRFQNIPQRQYQQNRSSQTLTKRQLDGKRKTKQKHIKIHQTKVT